jgi:signal transduction histidine kinase
MIGDVERETATVRNVRKKMPSAIAQLGELGMRAYSGIPLLHQNRSLGALCLFSRQPRIILAEDEALQTAIGQQIATAVINARLFKGIADERGRLQALIESSRDGIILVGIDYQMLVVNAPAVDFLRLPGQPKDWVNRSLQDATDILERHVPRATRAILAEMDRGRIEDELPGEGECEIPPRAIRLISLPVMADTTPLGRLLVLRDVTEERLLERMRDDLIHAMVHDLRNPLSAIYGALTFLTDIIGDDLSEPNRQLWDIAVDNTQRMLKLVRAILEISQLENRQMPLDHALVSLPDLVTTVLGSLSPLAADKGLDLASDVSSTLPPVWVDAGLIERVLQNLIGNAIKFTPSGGNVRVAVKDGAKERPRLLVTVSDTGPGIPPELSERLFQKFVTGKQRGRGSGLGLAFCKMVIEAHGEHIWVEESSEDGTTFAFTLPLPSKLES